MLAGKVGLSRLVYVYASRASPWSEAATSPSFSSLSFFQHCEAEFMNPRSGNGKRERPGSGQARITQHGSLFFLFFFQTLTKCTYTGHAHANRFPLFLSFFFITATTEARSPHAIYTISSHSRHGRVQPCTRTYTSKGPPRGAAASLCEALNREAHPPPKQTARRNTRK